MNVITNFINKLSISDIIQIIIAIALIFTLIETYRLRKEQRKATYLYLLDMEMRDKNPGYKARIGYPLIVRRIIEYGSFDIKSLYSPAYHKKIYKYKITEKIVNFLKRFLKKIK